MQLRRRGGPRPGNLLRQRLPLRGEWTEEGPGWLELDPVALCGGARDDRPLWRLDGVDIRTDWTEPRALENRGQHCPLTQLRDREASLPFALLGMDSDHGGECLNPPRRGRVAATTAAGALHPFASVSQERQRPRRAAPLDARAAALRLRALRESGGRAVNQRLVQRPVGSVPKSFPAPAQTGKQTAGRRAHGAGVRRRANPLRAGAGRRTRQRGPPRMGRGRPDCPRAPAAFVSKRWGQTGHTPFGAMGPLPPAARVTVAFAALRADGSGFGIM
jgi:hypothetical protein